MAGVIKSLKRSSFAFAALLCALGGLTTAIDQSILDGAEVTLDKGATWISYPASEALDLNFRTTEETAADEITIKLAAGKFIISAYF